MENNEISARSLMKTICEIDTSLYGTGDFSNKAQESIFKILEKTPKTIEAVEAVTRSIAQSLSEMPLSDFIIVLASIVEKNRMVAQGIISMAYPKDASSLHLTPERQIIRKRLEFIHNTILISELFTANRTVKL